LWVHINHTTHPTTINNRITGITSTDEFDTIGLGPDDIFGIGAGLDEYGVASTCRT